MTHKESLETIRLASSELDRLRAEIARLTRERDEAREQARIWKLRADASASEGDDLHARALAAEKERDEWKKANEGLTETWLRTEKERDEAREGLEAQTKNFLAATEAALREVVLCQACRSCVNRANAALAKGEP